MLREVNKKSGNYRNKGDRPEDYSLVGLTGGETAFGQKKTWEDMDSNTADIQIRWKNLSY